MKLTDLELKQYLPKIGPTNVNVSFAMSQIFLNRKKMDYEVFLPSIGENLQRDLVWDNFKKSEFIKSVILGKNIPKIVLIFLEEKNIYQVIDGKQRICSLVSFRKNDFSVEFGRKNYCYSDMDLDIRNKIDGFFFLCDIYYDTYFVGKKQIGITDRDKIDIFEYYNFMGEPQDKIRFEKLKFKI